MSGRRPAPFVRRTAPLLRALVSLALGGFLATAAANPVAVPPNQTNVRVCYNDQLGPVDNGHFSMLLLRAVAAHASDARFEYLPLPWVRCLVLASRGEVDAVLGASFTPERALDLVYPRDAEGRPDASRRLFSQGYRLLRRRGDALDTDGQRFFNLVGPIGVERGHSSVTFARERGASVDESHPNVLALLAKLRSGRLGGVMVAEPHFSSLRGQPEALAGLEAVATPLEQRDYYLVFSSAFAKRHPALMERLWAEAARQRESPAIRRATAEQQGRYRADVPVAPPKS